MLHTTTFIFDMDGLLIDSEPLWKIAADEVFANQGIYLSQEEYNQTTGLRTVEFLSHWLEAYDKPLDNIPLLNDQIIEVVTNLILTKGAPMPGAVNLVKTAKQKGFKTAIASSSPLSMIKAVTDKLSITSDIDVCSSAEHLPFGKPHPEVFIACTKALKVSSKACLVFEDSFNGLLAAKSAKMRCVVVPAPQHFDENRWCIADQKLRSLKDFNL